MKKKKKFAQKLNASEKRDIKILINQFSTFGQAHVRIEAIITVINCSITNDKHAVVFVHDYLYEAFCCCVLLFSFVCIE